MDVLFASRDLQLLCNEQAGMIKRWGPDGAAAVGQRLQEMDAADQLGDLRLLPHLRVTVDDRGDEIIVEDPDGVRLRLSPRKDNPSRRRAGPWHESQAVVVLDLVVEDR